MTGGKRYQQKSFRGRAPQTTMKKSMSKKFKDTEQHDLLQEEETQRASSARRRRLPSGSHHVNGSSSTNSMPSGVARPSNNAAPADGDEDGAEDAVQELRAELDKEAQGFVERVAMECNAKGKKGIEPKKPY